ncbi:hypothetical protein [Bacillus sp. FJAT-47783]|uniref:hypothetical protein n=1 Tax=Bacillus sp. FJAT-47783 TaxID=2922712 RepID=UPI001FAD9F82|nr:hypothetical protein [Bacillus sp. FJAT-47783]
MTMDAFRIGPLTIQYLYVFAILSFIITYYLIQALQSTKQLNEFFRKHYWNGVFLFVISYKASTLLTSPSLLLKNPLAFLYFATSSSGIYVGLIMTFLYILFQNIRNKSLTVMQTCWLFGWTAVIYFIVFKSVQIILLNML